MSITIDELDTVLSRSDLIYNAKQIEQSIDEMAAKLNDRLKTAQPLVLCVMNGALIFTAHLLTRLNCYPEVDYVHATRYGNQTTGDTLDWRAYPNKPLKDRTILLVDDILDEGITLKALIDYCYQQGAKEVVSAVLVQKIHSRCVEGLQCDYIGLKVEDQYVYGFGMDYKSQLRHLNGIYAYRG